MGQTKILPHDPHQIIDLLRRKIRGTDVVGEVDRIHTCGNINVKDRKNAMVEITELPIGYERTVWTKYFETFDEVQKKIRAPIKKYQVRNLVDGRISYLLHIDQFHGILEDLVTKQNGLHTALKLWNIITPNMMAVDQLDLIIQYNQSEIFDIH